MNIRQIRKIKRTLLVVGAAVGLTMSTVAPSYAAGGGSTVTVAAGAAGLTVSGAAPGSFTATLSGADQNVYTTLGTYSVADTRGTGVGWNVTFQSTQFSCTAGTGACPTGGDSFPTGSLVMAPPTVACASGTSCTGRAVAPGISIASNTAIDTGSAVKMASASANKGMGSYNFTPGTIGTGSLQLTVPGSAYASTYSTTLTVSVVSGP